MRIALALLTALTGLALVSFVYQQVLVEGRFGPAAIVGTIILAALLFVLCTLTYLCGTRHRTFVANILLVLISTVVTYVVVDLVAGWLLIVPLSPPLVPDPYRHHALVPDSFAELRQRDFSYIQRVNHFGLRGRETSVNKPAGTRRILMLGDSFTMGKGVEDDQTFSVLLETILGPRLAACGQSVEVLNAGVDSYAPILSYIQFRRELAPFSPDLVMLNLDHSDLVQEAAYRSQAVRDDRGEVIAVPQIRQKSLYERFLGWASRNLYLTRLILVRINRAMDHREISVRRVVNEFGREHFAHTLEGDIDRTAQWQDVFESIGRIKGLADAIHAGFVLTTYPWAHQLTNAGWERGRKELLRPGERTTDLTQRTIRQRSGALGIELLETYPAFRDYRGTGPLYFDYDPHWTPAGHEVMAAALASYITEHQVPRWCAEH